MSEFVVTEDDPRLDDVSQLLLAHLDFAKQHSPPEDMHALDVNGLVAPDLRFFSIREGGELLGVGALKDLGGAHGELKSIHTAATARGRGVGKRMVTHLIDVARTGGFKRLSLETGSMDAFAPSRALYESLGFEVTEPFGDYWDSPYSVCMTREI